jgi:glycine dehydrogenase
MHLRSQQQHEFIGRHIGPNDSETSEMLRTIGCNSMDELIQKNRSGIDSFTIRIEYKRPYERV